MFAILSLAFRSAVIALRSVVTLAVMLVCIFGAAAAIYCEGRLGEGGVLNTFSGDYGLFWLMPIISFSLATGLVRFLLASTENAGLLAVHARTLHCSAVLCSAHSAIPFRGWITTYFSLRLLWRSARRAGPTTTPLRWACSAAAPQSLGQA